MLELPAELRPQRQPFRYPAHNRDYGVEQDFLDWLAAGGAGPLEPSPRNADWHYLGVYWTRWHLNHDYGRTGREDLQAKVDASLIDRARTFTVCQYDDGPGADLPGVKVWLASRRGPDGRDAPLLASPHRLPWMRPRKRWKASFMGRLSTHPMRSEMARALEGRPDVRVVDGDFGERAFVRLTLASRMALSPRGYGGSSFRFFEAMRLGVVPCLVGDVDTRPFRAHVDWNACSFYLRDPAGLPALLDSVDDDQLERMGRLAATVMKENLDFGRWEPLLLAELARTAGGS